LVEIVHGVLKSSYSLTEVLHLDEIVLISFDVEVLHQVLQRISAGTTDDL
jgi:hypothetical protein